MTGDPLVSATTDYQGKFTITNAPVGTNIPIVLQTGRWRRQLTIANVASCVDNPQAGNTLRLPQNRNEGDIPLMAFATGAVDELECVLRKIGIADGEFTNPNGMGRVHFFTGGGDAGARINNQTTAESQLWGNLGTLDNYDMVLLPCQGGEYTGRLTAQGKQNLVSYADMGGRVFTTHFGYVWLNGNGTFNGAANWLPMGQNHPAPTPDPQTGFIDMTFPKGDIMAKWLLHIGASTVLGEMAINTLRKDFTTVIAPTQGQGESG